MQTYPSYIYQLQNVNFYFFTESLLNIHVDVLRHHWIPVFMPIYDQEKGKRPTQGCKCDSARAMRLHPIAGGIFWDIEGQNSERSRGVTWQRQQAPARGSLVS